MIIIEKHWFVVRYVMCMLDSHHESHLQWLTLHSKAQVSALATNGCESVQDQQDLKKSYHTFDKHWGTSHNCNALLLA